MANILFFVTKSSNLLELAMDNLIKDNSKNWVASRRFWAARVSLYFLSAPTARDEYFNKF